MALTTPGSLILRLGSQDVVLGEFELPLRPVPSDKPGEMTLLLDTAAFRADLADLLREAAAEVLKLSDDDFDPRTSEDPEDPDMKVYVTTIARVCHEANRVLQIAAGEAPSPHWADAPEWQRESAISGVREALAGATPPELHERWREKKTAEGWVYGPVKDDKAKTHPCLLPYEALPQSQRVKDHLFHAIVRAFPAAAATLEA